MKKISLLLFSLAIFNLANAQNVVASIGTGSTTNSLRIYLRPDVTNAAAVFSTLQFTVALPSSITPVPTLNIVNTAFSAAPASSWIVEAPYIENGFIVYPIFTAAAGFTLPVTANTEFVAMEVNFTNGPLGNFANAGHIICLPDGGTGGSGSAYFFCSGSLNSNGSNLFYAKDAAVTIANGFSYRFTDPTDLNRPAGTFTSFARLGTAITLPVKFTSFLAFKQNNDGLLNWTVENQNTDVQQFDIERSFNGTTFTKIAQQNPIVTSNGYASYNLTDAGVFDNYKGTVYYRIKQLDRTGAITYSVIRTLKADSKALSISLYPNPVIEKANLAFNIDKAQQVGIQLIDAQGKLINNYSIQAAKGINQKNIDVQTLANGVYTFVINTLDKIEKIQFVKSN